MAKKTKTIRRKIAPLSRELLKLVKEQEQVTAALSRVAQRIAVGAQMADALTALMKIEQEEPES